MENWKDVPGFEGLYQVSIDTPEGKCRRLFKGGKTKLLKNTQNKKGRIFWTLSKMVDQLTFNGEYIATYLSISQAHRNTGVDEKSIRECCNGVRKAAGKYKDPLTNETLHYTWRYSKQAH